MMPKGMPQARRWAAHGGEQEAKDQVNTNGCGKKTMGSEAKVLGAAGGHLHQ